MEERRDKGERKLKTFFSPFLFLDVKGYLKTMNKKKRQQHAKNLLCIDTSSIWKPGVGIRCKRCKCGWAADFCNSKTLQSAMKMISKLHTKSVCDRMIDLEKELSVNCPYPCCNKKDHNGKAKKKTKPKKKEQAQ